MTLDETIDFLMRIREIDRNIYRLTVKHNEARSSLLLSGAQYDKPAVQISHENKMESVFASVDVLNETIYRLRCRKAELIIEICSALELLPDERESTILTAYYIAGMKINRIAERIEYTASHTHRLRSDGVKHLSEILTASNGKRA